MPFHPRDPLAIGIFAAVLVLALLANSKSFYDKQLLEIIVRLLLSFTALSTTSTVVAGVFLVSRKSWRVILAAVSGSIVCYSFIALCLLYAPSEADAALYLTLLGVSLVTVFVVFVYRIDESPAAAVFKAHDPSRHDSFDRDATGSMNLKGRNHDPQHSASFFRLALECQQPIELHAIARPALTELSDEEQVFVPRDRLTEMDRANKRVREAWAAIAKEELGWDSGKCHEAFAKMRSRHILDQHGREDQYFDIDRNLRMAMEDDDDVADSDYQPDNDKLDCTSDISSEAFSDDGLLDLAQEEEYMVDVERAGPTIQ